MLFLSISLIGILYVLVTSFSILAVTFIVESFSLHRNTPLGSCAETSTETEISELAPEILINSSGKTMLSICSAPGPAILRVFFSPVTSTNSYPSATVPVVPNLSGTSRTGYTFAV